MRRPALVALAGGAMGVAALLAVVGVPTARRPAPPPAGVRALASASITLPAEAESLPAGPHADLVTAHCTACHSAAMILTQPPLSAEQWKATVAKMREVYRAPVSAEDEPAIVEYLAALSAGQ